MAAQVHGVAVLYYTHSISDTHKAGTLHIIKQANQPSLSVFFYSKITKFLRLHGLRSENQLGGAGKVLTFVGTYKDSIYSKPLMMYMTTKLLVMLLVK